MKHFRLSFLAAAIIPAAILSSCGPKTLSDKEILTLIYEQTGGENWSESAGGGWLSENLSDWENVKLNDEGRVVELTLSEPKGVIPAEIGGLTELKKLTIYMKNKKGEDPESCIPGTISELKNLEKLHIYCSVPCTAPSLAEMPKLNYLSMRCPGSVYPEIASRNLTELTFNDFVGAIPDYVYEMPALKRLVINPQRLDEGISPKIAQLSALEHLQIDFSQFIGSVEVPDAPLPEEVFSMTNLQYLFLRGVSTSGTIPPAVGGMARLKSLILTNLGLSGNLPKELGDMPVIENLEIYNNKISGQIPAALFNAVTIKQLWLDHNKLTGSIPAEIGKLINLESLQLQKNNLSGSLPESLANCTKLGNGVFVDFSGNNFFEDIPEAIQAMPKFEKFKF